MAFIVFWIAYLVQIYRVPLEPTRCLRLSLSLNALAQTTGLITKSEVLTGRSTRGSSSATPRVTYAFLVDGKAYESHRISCEMAFRGPFSEPAEQVINRWPAGKVVPVYYDPDDPTCSVLTKITPHGRPYQTYAYCGVLVLWPWLIPLFAWGLILTQRAKRARWAGA
jgi:Protein of unknown function (DUF3592)